MQLTTNNWIIYNHKHHYYLLVDIHILIPPTTYLSTWTCSSATGIWELKLRIIRVVIYLFTVLQDIQIFLNIVTGATSSHSSVKTPE